METIKYKAYCRDINMLINMNFNDFFFGLMSEYVIVK